MLTARDKENLEQLFGLQRSLQLEQLLDQHSCQFRFCPERKTKKGDFRVERRFLKSIKSISINWETNTYRMIITVIHEFAHLLNWVKHKRKVRPHGKEWKTAFLELSQELNALSLFPEDIRHAVEKHFQNPSAKCGVDIELERSLNLYDKIKYSMLVIDLEIGDNFHYKGVDYQVIKKNRTRAVCKNLFNKRSYLIPMSLAVN